MYSLLYKSSARPDFEPKAIFKMLLKAKRYNRENNISGCILFRDGVFLQLLEGEKEQIQELYRRICNDQRHFHVNTLIEQDNTDRLWQDWSMAFYDLSGNDPEVTHKRSLLQIYFNTATLSEKSKPVFEKFRECTLQLLG